MYEYFAGSSDPPEWMGFAMVKADGAGLADELTTPDISSWPYSFGSPGGPEYQDDAGRRWCLLSKGYELSRWGGLLELHGVTSLAMRERKLKPWESTKVTLDPHFADQPYTPELYEKACHLLGSGATWCLNSGNGYRLVRLHLADWWRGQASLWNGRQDFPNVRPMFEFILYAGREPEKHIIYAPKRGRAKVQEFIVKVDDPDGQLQIEVRRCEDTPSWESPPCFCGFEVMQVPLEEEKFYARQKQEAESTQVPESEGMRHFQTLQLNTTQHPLDRTIADKGQTTRQRKDRKPHAYYIRGFGKWVPPNPSE